MPPLCSQLLGRKVIAASVAAANTLLAVAGTIVAIKRGHEEAELSAGPWASPSSPPKAGLLPPKVTAAEVAARPWPARVQATGAWKAHLQGTGADLRIWAPLTVTGGALRVDSGVTITFPDGADWMLLDDLPTANLPFQPSFLSGGAVQGSVPIAGRTLTGRFEAEDGTQVDQLAVPAGTSPVPAYVVPRPGMKVLVDASISSSAAGIEDNGLSIELAGSVKAKALGQAWNGLVGSVEADQLKVTATWANGGWSVTADAPSARQLWIDVWPVVDTVLDARSGYDGGAHSCVGDCSVRLRYANAGAATAQIMEVEAVGAPYKVDLGINTTNNHDAGLGVRRGGTVTGFGGGRPIDSHLRPGDRFDRGLTYTRGVPVTLIIRGNFPEVRVTLAIPAVPSAA